MVQFAENRIYSSEDIKINFNLKSMRKSLHSAVVQRDHRKPAKSIPYVTVLECPELTVTPRVFTLLYNNVIYSPFSSKATPLSFAHRNTKHASCCSTERTTLYCTYFNVVIQSRGFRIRLAFAYNTTAIKLPPLHCLSADAFSPNSAETDH